MRNRHCDRCRESFDGIAELYDRVRPAYSEALVNDLVELTALCIGTRVLEIGCGTGQLTLPLAERGASLRLKGRAQPRFCLNHRRGNAAIHVMVGVEDVRFPAWSSPARRTTGMRLAGWRVGFGPHERRMLGVVWTKVHTPDACGCW